MKEHPILFCGEMVRAIMDGRKTQTRRIAKLDSRMMEGEEADWCPYGGVDDKLWVRETWATTRGLDHVKPRDLMPGFPGEYRAGGTTLVGVETLCDRGRWRSSIHLPRHASRIMLELISVRAERLQDISEEDAIAEGVESPAVYVGRDGSPGPMVQSYAQLWNELNFTSKRSLGWDKNPWVWRLEFRRIKP